MVYFLQIGLSDDLNLSFTNIPNDIKKQMESFFCS